MTELGKLDRLAVKGFKSIREVDLQLGQINILIGPNGAGKSVFISLFKLLHEILNKDLQLYVGKQGGADKILHFGRRITPQLELYIEFTPNAYQCILVPQAPDTLIFQAEQCIFYADKIGYLGGTKYYGLASPGSAESGLPSYSHTASPSGHVVGYLKDWRVYHFHDTSDAARVKQTARIQDTGFLRANAENLAPFLYQMRHVEQYANAYDNIVHTIQRVAPFFQDFILDPEEANPNSLRLRWKHRGTDEYFDATDFSDGTLRFICLTTLLLQPRPPKMILLDEPELGLHPYAIQILAGMMRSAASRSQLIVSTQSVTLANQFQYNELIIVERKDEASVFRHLSEAEVEPWLGEYGLGDLWEKNVIGATPGR